MTGRTWYSRPPTIPPECPRIRVVHRFLFLLFALCPGALIASKPASNQGLRKIYEILGELRTRLQLPDRLEAMIVPVNSRMVSVERHSGKNGDAGTFIMCFDEKFLASLNEEELRAAIAHELGHVWIFSHHPYLHTEALANEIAMKAVGRASLEKMYTKLWVQTGVPGNLEELLGAAKPSGTIAGNR